MKLILKIWRNNFRLSGCKSASHVAIGLTYKSPLTRAIQGAQKPHADLFVCCSQINRTGEYADPLVGLNWLGQWAIRCINPKWTWCGFTLNDGWCKRQGFKSLSITVPYQCIYIISWSWFSPTCFDSSWRVVWVVWLLIGFWLKFCMVKILSV